MSLSKELVAKFVKITNDRTKPQTETTLYGEITEYAGEKYVKLDGSDQLTPISSMSSTVGLTGVKVGDRVMVMIKNHTAVLIGNTSQPSINKNDLNNVTNGAGDAITELYALVADKVSASELNAVAGRIETLETDYLTVNGTLNAQSATVNEIKSAHVTITSTLTAQDADIKKLSTDKLDASVAAIKYATIEKLESIEGDFHTLESTYAKFEKTTTSTLTAIDGTIKSLDTKYANIDFSNIGEAAIKKFYSTSGIIKNLTVSNGTYTGELVGVKISGDLIKANTVLADKLVIKGTNGLYYKLNTDGMKTEAEQTNQNSLDGSVILTKSITATKISVSDLVAFGATIGGFVITDEALHSSAKPSATNATRGVYLDNSGQMAVGDATNYVKYYKDGDAYKLDISANDISLSGDSLTASISTASKSATDFMSLKTEGLVIGNLVGSALGKNVLIASDSVRIRTGVTENAIFGADLIELAKNNASATISMLNGRFKIYYSSDIFEAGLGVYGVTTNGEERLAFQPLNENNNLTLGWGGYNAKANCTNIYGHNINLIAGNDMAFECEDWKINIDGNLFAKASTSEFVELIGLSSDDNTAIGHGGYSAAIGKTNIYGNKIQHIVNTKSGSATYKPYYEAGDSFETEWYGAGFISSGSKVVYFSIPLSKPIIGSTTPNVTVANATTGKGGLQIRQDSNYVFGSSSTEKATPSSYSAKVVGNGNFVQIEATMANTTNAVNNAPCGINAFIKITFS